MSQSLFAILRRRLIIVGLALTAASLAVVSFYYADWSAMRSEKLDEQVERIASVLQRDATGTLTASLSAAHKQLFDKYPSAYAYRVQDGDGMVVSEANASLIPLGVTPASLPDILIKATFGSSAPNSSLTTIHRVSVAGTPAYVTFAGSSDPAGLTWRIFSGEIVGHVVAPVFPFALLLTLVNLWTIKKSLAPLANAAAAADRIRDTPGLEPLPDAGLPAEIKALVQATNAALERLARALEAERAFTAEVAHALRTPLAILSARLDTLAPDSTASAIRPDIGAMIRLVNQMLAAAQADNLIVDQTSQFDLAAVARDVVAKMAPLALREGRSIAQEGSERATVRGDTDAVAHALRNIIENALRHTPVGTEVVVAVEARGSVEVRDAGPGIPDDQKALAVRRFWRGANSGSAGTGLGLSIAQRIMEAHGGELSIGDGPSGGAVVRLKMWRAPLAG